MDSAVADDPRRLLDGAVDALPEGRLQQQLAEGTPLRVKFGVDPTSPDIHLGHCVVLMKLRAFQDAGHTVVLIIGDYTARVGDPSGRDTTRPILSPDELEANAHTYEEQAFTVLDRERTELRHNSEWLAMKSDELFGLIRRFTVARLLEREDFTQRMRRDEPISALELLYPVLQGYDSVAVRADVELGATDQKFNLLFARDVQGSFGLPEQSILTMPILVGTDGTRKMSKTYGNYVGVTDPPEEMFGKLMSIPDEAMEEYYRLLLSRQPDPAAHPAEAKRELARALVERFHDAEKAAARRSEVRSGARQGRAPGGRSRRRSSAREGPTARFICPHYLPSTSGSAAARRAGSSTRVACGSQGASWTPASSTCRRRTLTARCCRWASAVMPGFAWPAELDGAARLVPRPGSPALLQGASVGRYTRWSPSRRGVPVRRVPPSRPVTVLEN